MLNYEVKQKLEELKYCEKICIITQENLHFVVNYTDVINNVEDEYIYVKAPLKEQEKMFLYCSIREILPA